ncbi:sugar transferase [Candidatus Auribacterota bacterium]
MYSKEKQKIKAGLYLVLDALVIATGFVWAYNIKVNYLPSDLSSLYPFMDYLWILFLMVPLLIFIMHKRGLYEDAASFNRCAAEIIKAIAAGAILLVLFLFIFKIQYVSRLFIFVFAVLSILLLLCERFILLKAGDYLMPKEYRTRHIILAGDRMGIERGMGLFVREMDRKITIEGFMNVGRFTGSASIGDIPYLGELNAIQDVFREHAVDEIVFMAGKEHLSEIKNAVYLCEQEGMKAHVIFDYFDTRIGRLSFDEFYGVPAITVSTISQKIWQLFFKQIIDFFMSAVLLVLLSPVFLLFGLLIRSDSSGPVFFRQVRVGLKGRLFQVIKFRSMVHDAEKLKDDIKEYNELRGPIFKMADDPRVTKIGRLLRKYHLDELPQLINVLKGDMSIVGPRPSVPEEVYQYKPWQRRRLSMKPGITGNWQVKGQEIKDFDERVRLDLDYIDNWSLVNDVKIALKTILFLFSGKGM